MVYSGWKFILFLVFDRMTSNFVCLTFSTLRSSSLWRIVTIFLSLEKAVYRPVTTSPSSRNLASVGESSKVFSRCKMIFCCTPCICSKLSDMLSSRTFLLHHITVSDLYRHNSPRVFNNCCFILRVLFLVP